MTLQPRRGSKSNKAKGTRFEDSIQRKLATKTVGSGNLWFSPTDLNYDVYAVECKYSDNTGYRVTADLLEKLWSESLSLNKEPCLVVGIKRNDKQMFVLRCRIEIENRQSVSKE